MRLVVAFIQDYDSDRLLQSVTQSGLSATKISSLGGFLRTRNSTILIGLEDDQVSLCLRLLEQSCRSRVEVQLDPTVSDYADWYAAGIHEVTIGGAVVFVLKVQDFVRIPAATSAQTVLSASG
jgi:uncharacterized protein YaaQ